MKSLYFIERQFLMHAVVKLRGACRFMTRDARGDF